MKFGRRDFERQGNDLRTTLLAMVTSDAVLGLMEPYYRRELFEGPSVFVAEWCIAHFRKHGKAPKQRIRDYFERLGETSSDEAVLEGVSRLLSQVSSMSKRDYDDDFLAEGAERYLQDKQKRNLQEQFENTTDAKEITTLLEQHALITLTEHSGLNLRSIDKVKEAIDRGMLNAVDSVITFDGDLGKFFGNTLRRGAFIALQAPEKGGKSFWLLEMFYRVATARKPLNVVYFECGDLTEMDFLDRLWSRELRKPTEQPNDEQVAYPRGFGDDGVEVEWLDYEMMTHKDRHTAADRFARRSKKRAVEFEQAPSGTLSVAHIRNKLKNYKRRHGNTPDVVVVDYADILDHSVYGEGRDGINGSWIALRGIAIEFDCLVVTATQADAASYGKFKQTRSNFSDDKRKYSHVTGCVALNMDTRAQCALWCVQWLVRRHGRPTPDVLVAGCLELGRPLLRSVFGHLTYQKDTDGDES